MQWVIQSNIYAEEGFDALLEALDRLGLPKTLVKVVPFEGRLEAVEGELPADEDDAIVMGSYTLARVAKQRRWRPGAFVNGLDYESQYAKWGTRMLNAGAHVCRFDSVAFQMNPFFLRPVHDTKAFTGFVCDWGYYDEWLSNVRRMTATADPVTDQHGVNLLSLDTPVMVCRKQEIYSETRTWIVDGRVVTASGYKVGTIKRYTPPGMVDEAIIKFAEECIAIHRPDIAFVLDVAETEEGYKICEVNNFNSAGFYKGDMSKVIQALEGWAEDGHGLLW